MGKRKPMMDLLHGKPWSRGHFEATDPDVARCLYLIEADSYAFHQLWSENSSESPWKRADLPGVGWPGGGAGGPVVTVGMLGKRPVCLSMNVVEIDGVPVCFYDACSQVVDHDMVERFLDIAMPGVPRTNASNFHNFARDLKELKAMAALRREVEALREAAGPGRPSASKSL